MCVNKKRRKKKKEGNVTHLVITADLAGHDLDDEEADAVVPLVLLVDLVGLVENPAGEGAVPKRLAHFEHVTTLQKGMMRE